MTALVVMAASGHAMAAEHWRAIYSNDAAGRPLTGDKGALIAAVRAGEPIRVGFSLGKAGDLDRVEHFAEARFITIVGGSEVYAQIGEYVTQEPGGPAPHVNLRSAAVLWSSLIGTTGVLENGLWDRGKHQKLDVGPVAVPVTWYAADPSGDGATPSSPPRS
ncbi:MAG: hypothetical protein JSR45_17830 [Proteobacteria bacterium]|nr:hypothetical protein [Pseudomonadota bacterium]